MISRRTNSMPKEDVIFPRLVYCDSRRSQVLPGLLLPLPVTLKAGRIALIGSYTCLKLTHLSLHSTSSPTLLEASSHYNISCWCYEAQPVAWATLSVLFSVRGYEFPSEPSQPSGTYGCFWQKLGPLPMAIMMLVAIQLKRALMHCIFPVLSSNCASWMMCAECSISLPHRHRCNILGIRCSGMPLNLNEMQWGWTSSRVAISACAPNFPISSSIWSNLHLLARYCTR